VRSVTGSGPGANSGAATEEHGYEVQPELVDAAGILISREARGSRWRPLQRPTLPMRSRRGTGLLHPDPRANPAVHSSESWVGGLLGRLWRVGSVRPAVIEWFVGVMLCVVNDCLSGLHLGWHDSATPLAPDLDDLHGQVAF
jgi:transposase InsO family protein